MKTFRSSSSVETKKFAEHLAKKFLKARPRSALVLSLVGELGSGKTTFVQGFLRGLGIKKRAVSPTFIIFRRFTVRNPRFANLYHVDAYRMKGPRELLKLGFREILSNPKNIVLIEWGDRVQTILPKAALRFKFSYREKETERSITVVVSR